MRSSTRWVVEIVAVSLVLVFLTWAVEHLLLSLTGRPAGNLEKILVTLYIVLAGLVIELVRWARESISQASETVRVVLRDELAESAEKAVRGAVLRSIFPSGNPDPVNARIHFGIVEAYLRQVESLPALIQRASGVLAEQHLAAWGEEVDDLVGRKGVSLKMDESARMSWAMMEGGTEYLTIERSPCDPETSWSPGFLKFIDELGGRPGVQKKFILLAASSVLWGEGQPPEDQEEARRLFCREEEYLRHRGFQVFFCDERVVHIELGTTEIPRQNFEIFSKLVALQMDPAPTYDRVLSVRLSTLGEINELQRFLAIVEEQARKVTSRAIKAGRVG